MGEDDRRKHQRKKKQSIVSFHIIQDDGPKKASEAKIIDGSRGGVRLQTKESFPKNTQLYIKLDSEDWGDDLTYLCKDNGLGLVEVLGSVMWCLESDNSPGEYEIGTCFIDHIEQ